MPDFRRMPAGVGAYNAPAIYQKVTSPFPTLCSRCTEEVKGGEWRWVKSHIMKPFQGIEALCEECHDRIGRKPEPKAKKTPRVLEV